MEQDDVQAVHYYRLAADQGHAGAQNNLAVCLAQGKGVEKDEAEAVRYYRLAADQGDADAQFQLALYLASGQGVSRDESRGAALCPSRLRPGLPARPLGGASTARAGAGVLATVAVSTKRPGDSHHNQAPSDLEDKARGSLAHEGQSPGVEAK